MEAHEQRQLSDQQSSILFTQHHQVHLKREKRKEEEQRRKQWVDQEREKTLSRLRSFREVRRSYCLCPASPLQLVLLLLFIKPQRLLLHTHLIQ
ncbi:WASP homolog-associated protein with actin, membranes and microtubules-like [Plectropomus leopardus]|uniref:WASP homolog-associated protein with actin, membranes and microtubules-like n=1 Tax=Plectropomus leopardus TaxID=160734 RepID=UPI001C4D773C|nr:WASP homolog-associated protein with actin, membranes and microtubules-like [Plectropomus leopardus]